MAFDKLSFGAPAAERDIAQGLADYFVESQAYYRVKAGDKTVILGNRGAGKSAIFKVLAERERKRGTIVIELSPEDYSYEMLNKSLEPESKGSWAKQGAYSAAWKYLIYCLIMRAIDEKRPGLKTGSAGKIYTYLRDHHDVKREHPIAILISYLKRIEGLKIGKWEASVKTRELTSLYRVGEIGKLIDDIIEVCKKIKVVVLIDELDKGWDFSEDAKAFVSGLFQACISLNQHSKNIRVYVSLRKELYDSIPALYEDAQKYRDIIETISWDEPSLLSLIAKRIRHTVPELVDANDRNAWDAIYAEVLEYRGTKSFNYLIDRTLYRPREIIQFCTDTLEEARKRGIFPINYPTISTAELVYSESKAKDIAAEFRFQYPGLLSIFEAFRGKPYNLEREDLEYICLGITTGEFKTDSSGEWVLGQDYEFIIDMLWKIGFLKAYAVGGIKALARSGSSYLGSHQVGNLNLRNIDRFHVHPMFRTYYGMKESKE